MLYPPTLKCHLGKKLSDSKGLLVVTLMSDRYDLVHFSPSLPQILFPFTIMLRGGNSFIKIFLATFVNLLS